jgi:nitrite reductase/ring-hydroxylating ferredoxin subunit
MTPEAKKIPLGKAADIPPGRSRNFRAAGKDLIVVNTGDGIRGYINFCTHMGGKLRCLGEKFQCDWHGSQFDCGTGESIVADGAPASASLEKAEIIIEGDELFYLYTPKKSPWALD